MSMNFSEFKNLMGADPLNREPETLLARNSGPEFEQAATEAEAFEQKLQAVMRFPVDAESLTGDVLAIPGKSPSRMPAWMAIAASLVLVVGVASTMMDGLIQPGTVEEYVQQHYNHDGEKLLARSDQVVSADQVQKVLAGWGLEAGPELLGRVTYIKKCFTMDGLGAHMVVQTSEGPVNLIVMPKTAVTDRELVEFDGMQAYLVALGSSSAAIIGRADQSVGNFDQLVRGAISKAI